MVGTQIHELTVQKKKLENPEWRLKVLLPCFLLSSYFHVNNSKMCGKGRTYVHEHAHARNSSNPEALIPETEEATFSTAIQANILTD